MKARRSGWRCCSRRSIGVDEARAVPAGDTVVRELALIRVRAPAESYGELLDVLGLYHANVIEEGPDGLVVELTGPDTFVLSCLRAVERFGIVDVARSGAVARRAAGRESACTHLHRGFRIMSSTLQVFYDSDAEHRPPPRPHDRRHRLRQPGPCARAQPEGVGAEGHRRAAAGRGVMEEGGGRRARRAQRR